VTLQISSFLKVQIKHSNFFPFGIAIAPHAAGKRVGNRCNLASLLEWSHNFANNCKIL